MSLRFKSLLYAIGIMVLMCLVMYGLAKSILKQSIEIYETDMMEKKVDRFGDLLLDAKNNLGQVAVSWSAWDEMCDFATNGNKDFVAKNLQENTFQMVGVDLIVVHNPDRGIVYAEGYDLLKNKIIDLEEEELKLFQNKNWNLYQHQDTKDVKYGLIEIAGEVCILAVGPIVTVQYQGPIRGSLVMGRMIDRKLVDLWMKKMDLANLEIFFNKDEGNINSEKLAYNKVNFVDKNWMEHSFFVRDNNRSIEVKMVANRSVNSKFELIAIDLVGWFSLIGVLFIFLMVVYLEVVVIRDISRTKKDIKGLMGGRTQTLSGRLLKVGGPEIMVLRETINSLLDEIVLNKKLISDKDRLLKIVVDNMVDVIWVMDLNLNCLYLSQSIEKMQGWTVEERMKLSLREVVPEESFEFLWKNYDDYMKDLNSGMDISGKFPVTYKFKHYRKDRSIFWVETIINLVYDELGNVCSFQGVERDISEREFAETKLKDSEEKFKTITNCALDGIAMIDDKGMLMVWNKAAASMFGYAWEEVKYKFIHDFILPEAQHDFIRQKIQEFGLTGQGNIMGKVLEVNAKRKNGNEFPVELSVSPVRYNDKWCAIAVMRDISERYKIVSKLKESEARYRELFNLIPDGVGIVMDQEMVLTNQANLNILGYKSETDFLGKNIIDMFPVEIRNLVADGLKKVEEGEQIKNREFKIVRADRRMIDIETFATAIDYDGKNAILTIFRDITARKKSDKDRARLENELKQRSKMETMGTLAGGIAHDFNNILASIMGYLELMRESIEHPDGPSFDCLDAISRTLKACERAAGLVRQILTYSRKNVVNKRPFEMCSLLKEVIKLVKVNLPAGVALVENINSSSFVYVDSVELHQVIMNLISNASYAMKKKEGVIELSLSDRYVNENDARAYLVQPGKYISLIVRDEGEGMGKDVQERVFEPFFTTKPVGEGTGMGLAMVWGIVKGCDGIVRLESEIETGTSIEILLPVYNSINANEMKKPDCKKGSGTILVVDDEEVFLNVVTLMLQKMGYTVQSFMSPKLALEFLSKEKFDLIITDFRMPEMEGLQLVGKIKKMGVVAPIIMCSGFGDCLTREHVFEIGVADLLSKPCSMSELSEVVHKNLKK